MGSKKSNITGRVMAIAIATALGLAAWSMPKLFGSAIMIAVKAIAVAAVLSLVAWGLSKIFGRSNRKTVKKEVDDTTAGAIIAVAAVAGLGLAAGWGMSKLLESAPEASDDRKKMKAPGRDYKIYRDDFARDPAGYFRSLRQG